MEEPQKHCKYRYRYCLAEYHERTQDFFRQRITVADGRQKKCQYRPQQKAEGDPPQRIKGTPPELHLPGQSKQCPQCLQRCHHQQEIVHTHCQNLPYSQPEQQYYKFFNVYFTLILHHNRNRIPEVRHLWTGNPGETVRQGIRKVPASFQLCQYR